MNQHKRVWIYCRAARPDTMALESQKQRLLDSAREQGFEVAGITTEMTADLSIKRQGMSEVFSAAQERRMDTLFVINPSRITRAASEFLDCVQNLSEQGIEVLALDTGVVGLPEANFYAKVAKVAESMTD
ncbi:recombinase family protein [Enterocloster asparagiformis]|uniref:recombinase family protein n=1 Tax=Enterocloster asparagiformis TaxID=333367 RepID=UPI002A8062AA|nr:recombinase family protein [Enterocloster asparagiformis]